MAAIAVSGGYERDSRSRAWIETTTTASVVLLAGIAAVVSYGHLHLLALHHGEGRLASALIPLSVDGMIVAASMSLLLDSRLGRRGGVLPWALLIIGALASLAANIAVAEPTVIGRVIAAWPSFALTASYELLMRQVRHAAMQTRQSGVARMPASAADSGTSAFVSAEPAPGTGDGGGQRLVVQAGERRVLQRRAWRWTQANRRPDGSLPSGAEVAREFRRCERWGRLVKKTASLASSTPQPETCRPGAMPSDIEQRLGFR
jgi:hypothetical protein